MVNGPVDLSLVRKVGADPDPRGRGAVPQRRMKAGSRRSRPRATSCHVMTDVLADRKMVALASTAGACRPEQDARMKAAVFESFGEPSQVLNVREVPDPMPGPGKVRVRMILSPINPSDLLVVQGLYGVLPKLPSTPGFEGVGIVDEVGPGMLARMLNLKGKRVVAINSGGGQLGRHGDHSRQAGQTRARRHSGRAGRLLFR